MCIQNNNNRISRPVNSSRRRSSWSPSSPSSLEKVMKSLGILKKEIDTIKEEMTHIMGTPTPLSTSTSRTTTAAATKKRVRKSVRFHKDVAVQQIIHKNNYTEEEIEECWYTQSESQNIRSGILMTLDLIRLGLFEEHKHKQNNNNTTTTTTTTSRGLENYNSDGTMKDAVRRRRQNAVWSVLDEQDLQVDKAELEQQSYLIYDDVAIRNIYKNQTRVSAETSYSMGRLDAEEVAVLVAAAAFEAFAATNNNDDDKKNDNNTSSSSSTFKNLFRKTEKRWSFTRKCSPINSNNKNNNDNEFSQFLSLTA